MRQTIILLLLILITFPSSVFAQREWALSQPIIEGKSILGINLGDSESDVFKVLGFPDLTESNFLHSPHRDQEGLKFLLYGLAKNNIITIYTRYGKVEAIHMFWAGVGQDPPLVYKNKTASGVGLGDSVKTVKKFYGDCKTTGGESKVGGWFCWDKNLGISFGAGADNIIRLIGIVSPGKELPDYLKPENQRF